MSRLTKLVPVTLYHFIMPKGMNPYWYTIIYNNQVPVYELYSSINGGDIFIPFIYLYNNILLPILYIVDTVIGFE